MTDSTDRLAAYEISLHPDSIRTKDVIEGISAGLLPHFSSWVDWDSAKGGMSKDERILYTGTATFTNDNKTNTIVVVAQNDRLLMPESLRHANETYLRAEKENLDVLTIVNTEGGFAGTSAALMGQSWLIANNIKTLLNLKTYIASLILRKGGSGGALSNQVSDIALMMEYANYYVIAPPHCSSILWRTNEHIDKAVEIMKPTAQDLLEAKVITSIIPEYPGGAHLEKEQGYRQTLLNIDQALAQVFVDFQKKRKSIIHHISSPIRSRLQQALSYGGELPFAQRSTQLFRRRRRKIAAAIIAKNQGIEAKDIKQLSSDVEQLRSYYMLTEFQELAKRSGSDDTAAIRCGYEGDKRVQQPGIIVEVNTAEMEKLQRAFRMGKIRNHEEYRQRVRDILLTTKTRECHATIPFDVFKDNHYSCPECGWGPTLPAHDWIRVFNDRGTRLQEFNEELDLGLITSTIYHTEEYVQKNKEIQEKLGLNSALVTAEGSIQGLPVTFAAMEFYFLGGSLSMDVGMKFQKAAEYALKRKQPLVVITSTGGARMQESILSLKMMEKSMATLSQIEGKIPYFVVIANPTFGGTPASFGSQGIITLAEKGAWYGFAGPRVIALAGGQIEKYAMHPTILTYVEVMPGKPVIDAVGRRNELKGMLSKYIIASYAKK
ncbi:MAG: carboxyl transferase domain-containing protein [archaeon]